MKKILLSLSLIITFAGYVLYARNLSINTPVVYKSSLPEKNVTLSTPKPNIKPKTNPIPNPPMATANTGKYRDGSYTGDIVDAYYGNVQVMAIISGGKITDVQFLDYPQDRQNSVRINSRAMPRLVSEAISIQDSNVNTVSGASFTSAAYRASLSSALSQARV